MPTQPFQRAHSQEQRAYRRQTILDTAAAMLAETSVAKVSLNELSRRVGLAKSNVLHYFESREDVLLELLDGAAHEWLAALAGDLAAIPADAPVADRCAALAAVLADTLAARPVFCDLIANQAAVLEHNVSPEVAARFKHAALANLATLAGQVAAVVPELGAGSAGRFVDAMVMFAGAAWTHSRPSDAVLAAYQAHPDLAVLRLDFATALRDTLTVLLAGFLTGKP